MIVVHSDQVKGRWTPAPHHREIKVLVSPCLQGVSTGMAIGMVTIPPGQGGEEHQHEWAQEAWYVLSGLGILRVGTEEVELAPGTIVVAPAGLKHQIANSGEEPLIALFIYTPAGPESALLEEGDAPSQYGSGL